MRILLDVGSHNCRNFGSTAAMQATVTRLRSQWEDASIDVLTDEPAALARVCPGVHAVPARECQIWFDDGYLGSARLPAVVTRFLSRVVRGVRARAPRLLELALRARMFFGGRGGKALPAFLDAVHHADIVAVTGQPFLNEFDKPRQRSALDLLEMAAHAGKLTAMFAIGLGPIEDLELKKKAEGILPTVQIVALREGCLGPGLLESMGVPHEHVIVTGDDAIEMTLGVLEKRPREALGINFRVDHTTALGYALIEGLRPRLLEFARVRHAKLLPLPIAMNPKGTYDPPHIRALLAGYDDQSDGGASLSTPERLICEVAGCRVILTAAYHAAVFSLSQGIPAVCLAGTRYSRDRFLGLQSQFGPGVFLVDGEDMVSGAMDALDEAWDSADALEPGLRRATVSQLEAGRSAYRRLAELWNQRGPAPRREKSTW